MNIVGVIAEYNPFHKGHLYQLNQIKSTLNPDGILCIMSGNFVQRGEPAIFNKWSRAEMALHGGVDLVVELPTCFSTSTAEIFAESSIRLLNKTKIVKSICFGIEKYNKRELQLLSNLLAEEPDLLSCLMKKHLKNGISFASARQQAILEYLSNENIDCDLNVISDILNKPNSILAIEYIKSCIKTNSKIEIYPIERLGADYHDNTLKTAYPSATAIRHALISDNNALSKVSKYLPDFTYNLIKQEVSCGRGPVFLKNFENMLLYILRRTSKSKFKSYFDVTEGLENRIKTASKSSYDLETLLSQIKSKRYAETKIKRILVQILLNIPKEIVMTREPQYLRVLGITPIGAKMLKEIKKNSDLPIITRASEYKKLDLPGRKMFEIDLFSSDVFCLAYRNYEFKKGNYDFHKKIIYSNPSK